MLENDAIALREIAWNDTDLIIKWRNNSNVLQNFLVQDKLTREQHENWMRTRVMTGEVVQFIIIDKSDQKPIGSVFLKDIERTVRMAEFGIFIGEDSARGKGIGTAACGLLTRYGFEKLDLNRIYLRVLPNNLGGIRCYQKCGYAIEGTLRQHVFVNGALSDLILMGQLKSDAPAMPAGAF